MPNVSRLPAKLTTTPVSPGNQAATYIRLDRAGQQYLLLPLQPSSHPHYTPSALASAPTVNGNSLPSNYFRLPGNVAWKPAATAVAAAWSRFCSHQDLPNPPPLLPPLYWGCGICLASAYTGRCGRGTSEYPPQMGFQLAETAPTPSW